MSLINSVKERIKIVRKVRDLGLTKGTRDHAQAQLERLQLTLQLLESQERSD
jgi:hypothetical protein